jgi:receptor-type tyrosine-protein phosphatase gamma
MNKLPPLLNQLIIEGQEKIIEEFAYVEGAEADSDLSYEFIKKNEDLQFIEQPVELREFRESMNKRKLTKEYEILRKLTESPIHAKLLREYNPELAKHNRYSTIIPFKHSQVVLPITADGGSESDSYINANYISSSKKGDPKSFIATQGPLELTRYHFWKMVWSENVSLVIMLCQTKEGNKNQCETYWCDKKGNEFEIENLRVSMEKVEDLGPNVKRRMITLENTTLNEKRVISHINWTGWPDHGIPPEDEFSNILFLLNTIHEERKTKKAPIVVHCSAGIGRTGTLLALFNVDLILKEAIAKHDSSPIKISVFGIVRRLREQRWGMVQTKDQYQFIYNYVADLIDKYLKEKDIPK